ncbi:hypothetical protein [Pseudomonas sp.]|jgi:hypothetical protein
MHHDNDHQPNPLETVTTLAVSGLTLALIILAGYLTPDLLARLG